MKKIIFILLLVLFSSSSHATTWSVYSTGTSYGTNGNSWAIQDGGVVVGCVQGSITSDIFQAIPGADIAVHRSNSDCTGTNNGQVGSSALANPDYTFYLYHSGSTVKLYYSTDYVADADGDGVNDDVDLCASTPASSEVDSDGCSVVQLFCSDLTQSPGEIGVDCGGICSAYCTTVCPPGDTIVEDVVNGDEYCASTYTPLSNGMCPEGSTMGENIYPNDPTVAGICLSLIRASIVSEALDQQFYIDEILAQQPEAFSTASTSGSVTYTPTQTVDNGDGTSTDTWTKVSTTYDENGNPITETTNYSQTFDSSSGASLGEASETTTVESSPDYNVSNYSPDNIEIADDTEISWGDAPDWSEIQTEVDITEAENAYTNTAINTSSESSLIIIGTYQGQSIQYDMAPHQGTLQFMGGIIVFMAYVNGFLIFAGAKQ